MSRLAALANGLFYPTPKNVVAGTVAQVQLLQTPQVQTSEISTTKNFLRVLDPCAGRGSAVIFLSRLLCLRTRLLESGSQKWTIKPSSSATGGKDEAEADEHWAKYRPNNNQPNWVELYGIELDAERGRIAAPYFTSFIRTNAQTAKVADESFDLLFHNPPYHSDDLEKRLEHAFLRNFTPTLRPGGIIVHIVPQTRLEISADYLAHRYENIRVWRFPDPYYDIFKQVVLVGVKRKKACADGDNVRRLREIAKAGPEFLEVLPCPSDDEVVALIKATNLPITQELFNEFDGEEEQKLRAMAATVDISNVDMATVDVDSTTPLEITQQLRAALEKLSPSPVLQPYALYPNYQFHPEAEEVMFRSNEYDTETALKEARTVGVWANRTLRDLVNAQKGAKNQRITPLTPLREGQAAQLIVNGLLDNMVLEENVANETTADSDNQSLIVPSRRRLLVKGHTRKEWVTKSVTKNENGEERERTLKEVMRTQITTLNLDTGEIQEMDKGMGSIVRDFSGSIRRQMLENYPPRYVPGRADPLTNDLEKGLLKLKRKPLGGQSVAMVAAATSLIESNVCLMSEEQGSGKSFQGTGAVHLSGSLRNLIVCPPQLVLKWVREVLNTVPGAKAEIVRNALEMKAAVARAKAHEDFLRRKLNLPEGTDLTKLNRTGTQALPGYYIVVSRERMKRGLGFRPVANLSVRPKLAGAVAGKAQRWCCPRCGQPVGNTDEDDFLAETEQALALEKAIMVQLEKAEKGQNTKTIVSVSGNNKKKGKKRKAAKKPQKGDGVENNSGSEWEWKGLGPLPEKRKLVCENPIRTWIAKPTEGRPLAGEWVTKIEDGADICGEPLWQARSRLLGTPPFLSPEERVSGVVGKMWSVGQRNIAISRFITKDSEMRDFWKSATLMVDEAHEYKAEDSAQGIEIGRLCRLFRRSVGMTGTICGGKASSIFFLLWRFLPQVRKEFAINELSRFIDRYGIWEKTVVIKKNDDDDSEENEILENGAISDRRSYNREKPREKPGIGSSVLLLMLPNTVFLKLADVSKNLPPYTEHVKLFPLDTENQAAYNIGSLSSHLNNHSGQYHNLDTTLREAASEALVFGSQRLLGALVQSLLAYPDMPYAGETVYDPLDGCVVASAMALSKDKIYPKEQALIDLYRQESAKGRKVLLFVTNTQKRDITPRLKWVLEKHTRAKVSVLKSGTVDASKREEWVQQRLKEGYDMLEVHPRCVQTGLDLYEFVTIVFYQIEYSTQVVLQAKRRSWRLGQPNPVDVYFFGYKGTAQEQALRLMAKKARAALSLEGDLESAGLVGLADDDEDEGDSIIALATELLKAKKKLADVANGEAVENEIESLEEIFNSLHAKELESEKFVLEDEDASEEAVEAAIASVYAATLHQQEQQRIEIEKVAVPEAAIAATQARLDWESLDTSATSTTTTPSSTSTVTDANANNSSSFFNPKEVESSSKETTNYGNNGDKINHKTSYEELRAAMLLARQQKLANKAKKSSNRTVPPILPPILAAQNIAGAQPILPISNPPSPSKALLSNLHQQQQLTFEELFLTPQMSSISGGDGSNTVNNKADINSFVPDSVKATAGPVEQLSLF